MIREVDLVSYLPPFIAEYKETNITLETENPEFVLVWKAADRVLHNEFIATADEYGISRFEKILNILPSRDDTLENRRIRVQTRWFTNLPYTWRMLLQKLGILCGSSDFKVYISEGEWYKVKVRISIEPQKESLLYEVEQLLEKFLPANLYYYVTGAVARRKIVGIFSGSTRTIHIKIKANPGSPEIYTIQNMLLKVGMSSLMHTKTIYQPERK